MGEKEEEEAEEEEKGGKAGAGTQTPCVRPAASAPASPTLTPGLQRFLQIQSQLEDL